MPMPVWECVHCALDFPSQAARQAHVNASTRHPHCGPCNRRFLNAASLRSHLTNSGAHNYCARCSRDFVNPLALRQHLRMALAHRSEHVDEDSDSSDSMPMLYSESDEEELDVGEDECDDDDDDDDDDDEGSSTGRPSENRNASGPGAGVREDDLVTQTTETTELLFRMTFEDHMSRAASNFFGMSSHGSGDGTPSWLGSSSESGDNEDDDSYVEQSSSNSEDSDNDNFNSDFLAHSDDESDTSLQTPYGQSTDVFRSTRTPIFPLPAPSAPPPAGTSPETKADPHSSLAASGSVNRSSGASLAKRAELSGASAGYTCPLCLEQEYELSSAKCGHVFCTPCINRALEKKRQCPICRSRAKIKDLRRIFLSF